MVKSYEPYSQAEILLDVTLEELLRSEHAIREHDKIGGTLMGTDTCRWFPCRMIKTRRDEAEEVILARLNDG